VLFGVTAVSGSNRVIRGGGWNNNARNCRSANRNNNSPGNWNNNLGARLVSTRSAGEAWFTDHARVHKALSRPLSCAGQWRGRNPALPGGVKIYFLHPGTNFSKKDNTMSIQYKFLPIPIKYESDAETELNKFLKSVRWNAD
jgi:uncharacterized protein (DUF3084 family)